MGLCPEQKRPCKICRAGGREFSVCLEHDGQTGEDFWAYPDFEVIPAYTGEGRPFATAAQESCSCRKPRAPDDSPPDDCGSCALFYRGETPYDPIGVCMCDARRRVFESKEE